MSAAPATASDRLRAALDERGVSIRALAVRLAGKGATTKRLDNVRGQIYDWLNGAQPTDANAERLAKALDYQPDYFKTDRARGARAAAVPRVEYEALLQSHEELRETVAGLKRSVASLQKRISALDRQPPGEARDTARGGRKR